MDPKYCTRPLSDKMKAHSSSTLATHTYTDISIKTNVVKKTMAPQTINKMER